jgi:hypothetical protein
MAQEVRVNFLALLDTRLLGTSSSRVRSRNAESTGIELIILI